MAYLEVVDYKLVGLISLDEILNALGFSRSLNPYRKITKNIFKICSPHPIYIWIPIFPFPIQELIISIWNTVSAIEIKAKCSTPQHISFSLGQLSFMSHFYHH